MYDLIINIIHHFIELDSDDEDDDAVNELE